MPYTYVYTYVNTDTGAESNPSVPMLASIGVTPNGTAINVVVHGSNDPQIYTYSPSIRIYRAGGSFGDGLYRLLGTVFNSGSDYITITFSDTLLDQDILSNQIVSTDNDPPVPAGLPIDFIAVSNTTGSAGTLISATFTIQIGPGNGFVPQAGDTIFVAQGTTESEECIVRSYNSALNTLNFYTQTGHSITPYSILCTEAAGSPCTLALAAFNSVFLAGEQYNPHYLYQSKPGQPESFPVIQATTGIIQSIAVGTPTNYINGLAEYNGTIVCLNLYSIFTVSVFQNQMQTPVATPARHGLITPEAWVKVMNAIWYLSYDGIYSFTGGEETWVSEPIDPLFKGIAMNGYLPINLTPGQGANNPPTGLDVITMTTVDNNVYMNYTDTSGASMRLVYELNFQRWRIESYYGNTVPIHSLTMQFSEPDTGYSWIGTNFLNYPYSQPQLDLVNTGTTDGWTVNPTLGRPIIYQFSPTVLDQQAKTDKLFSDIILETANTDQITINAQYNWSGVNDPIDQFFIPNGTRQRYPFALQEGSNGPEGANAYAMQLIMSGSATGATSFYSLGLHYEDLADYRVGLSMDYSDMNYPDDKTFRSITVEMDTGGVAATAYLDVDQQLAVATFTINTSYYNRKVILSVPSFITGKMARLRFQAGIGGKTNLYGEIAWDYEKLPASLTHFDSNTIAFNWNGYNFVKQVWMTILCASPVTMTLYGDNDVQFYVEIIPPMPARGTFRFYLPSVWNTVLNKSKVKRFTLDAVTPFSFYSESSRFEWLPCGADQRQDYEQLPLSEVMQPK